MPIMKQLEVDDVVYTTVGEASVTQVVSTGTKIATVTIDGTATDLYAPSGSSVSPATANPIMDGTAAVGSSAKYAREDHVHPTDTSRQETLVSGTNIKTINNESLLGSGNITIQGGGGGSESYKISLTLNGTTVSNVDYDGSSATAIATAVADDPTTDVVFVINAGSGGGVIIARPCMIQATYNATWGDIATRIYAVFPLWYEVAGDRETYLLRLSYSSEAWYAATRATL